MTDTAELARFLRARRAVVAPVDVGLSAGPRRRVDGLRRQEVAQLAGMSVDYYIRLEQGRGPRPSPEILAAIARALRLSDADRRYLFDLVGARDAERRAPSSVVRPGVLRMLDRLDDTPALVCNARYDVLAWNLMACALLGDFAALPPAGRNVVERFFTLTEVRARHDPAGGADFARTAVADLRATSARYPHDTVLTGLITRLNRTSAEFRDLWARHEVAAPRSAVKRLRHPEVGWLELDCEALHDPERDHWVILYTAAPGTPSYDALQLLRVIGRQQLGQADENSVIR